MNLANFYADRDRQYSGGMRWWIEHDAPNMRRQMEIPAGTQRDRLANHYRTQNSMISTAAFAVKMA